MTESQRTSQSTRSQPHGVPPGIEVLGTQQWEAWQRKTLPAAEKLRSGIWSIPVPIPDNPLRYTLCYLVPGDDGVVVVDPGWDNEQTWDALTRGLADAGVSFGDITGIVATHVHPDHHGLSGKLRENSDAWIAMHPAERDTLPQRVNDDEHTHASDIRAWLRHCGVPEDELVALFGLAEPPPDSAPPKAPVRPSRLMAEPDVLLEDGDRVPLAGRDVRAVWTPGHTPGHLCLRDTENRLALTGDHILPRISPNVGLYPGAKGSPLSDYLRSLERSADLDDHDALPAHEYRFRGIAARTRQLIEHHEHRCAEIISVVADLGAPTMWQVTEQLTWSRPWAEIGYMRMGAMSETAAHVEHLVGKGRLRFQHPEDRDGELSGAARLRLA